MGRASTAKRTGLEAVDIVGKAKVKGAIQAKYFLAMRVSRI